MQIKFGNRLRNPQFGFLIKIYYIYLVYCYLQNNYIIVIKIQMTLSKLATLQNNINIRLTIRLFVGSA
jgi:hypothetical protein